MKSQGQPHHRGYQVASVTTHAKPWCGCVKMMRKIYSRQLGYNKQHTCCMYRMYPDQGLLGMRGCRSGEHE
jgi:hypothetical protein